MHCDSFSAIKVHAVKVTKLYTHPNLQLMLTKSIGASGLHDIQYSLGSLIFQTQTLQFPSHRVVLLQHQAFYTFSLLVLRLLFLKCLSFLLFTRHCNLYGVCWKEHFMCQAAIHRHGFHLYRFWLHLRKIDPLYRRRFVTALVQELPYLKKNTCSS